MSVLLGLCFLLFVFSIHILLRSLSFSFSRVILHKLPLHSILLINSSFFISVLFLLSPSLHCCCCCCCCCCSCCFLRSCRCQRSCCLRSHFFPLRWWERKVALAASGTIDLWPKLPFSSISLSPCLHFPQWFSGPVHHPFFFTSFFRQAFFSRASVFQLFQSFAHHIHSFLCCNSLVNRFSAMAVH